MREKLRHCLREDLHFYWFQWGYIECFEYFVFEQVGKREQVQIFEQVLYALKQEYGQEYGKSSKKLPLFNSMQDNLMVEQLVIETT